MKQNKNKSEIAIVKESSQQVETFISQAIAAGLPVETMERLFGLREKVKAEQAKEAYVSALSDFQSVCPIIKKTRKVLNNKDKTVRYVFAPLDSIVEQIRTLVAASGLSYRWETKQENGEVRAICIVTHKLGHSESSEFSIPVDKEGYMTAPQKVASALTFAKRYSLCNALGISTGDEDVDATDQNKEKEPISIKAKIIFLVKQLMKPHATRGEVEKSVQQLVDMELKEENYEEIKSRLEGLVLENQQDNIAID